jgi:hypothetical protein
MEVTTLERKINLILTEIGAAFAFQQAYPCSHMVSFIPNNLRKIIKM